MSKRKQARSISLADPVEQAVAELAALRKVPGRGPIPRFEAALRSPYLAAAKTATMGLCDRKAIVAPLRRLLADPDPCLRWRACALAWFFMLRDCVPDLIRALRDPDSMVRAEAAWALRSADTDAAARALLRAMKDPDRTVAHYAAWTLHRIVQRRHPELPSVKGRRIVVSPLPPERPPRHTPAPPVVDDAQAFAQFFVSADRPTARAPRTDDLPVDGREKPAYRKAAAQTLAHIDGYPEPPLRGTEFRAAASDDALHLRIRCEVRNKRELFARHTQNGDPVYTDNSVEVFLDPTGTSRHGYYQICLNTKNTWCAVHAAAPLGHVWRPGIDTEKKPWRPEGLRTAVRVENQYWIAELRIPFDDLGLAPGSIRKLWRFNVTRNAHLPELYECTSWCDMGDYDAHQPDRFGWLWVDSGTELVADGAIFRQEPAPLDAGLHGWTTLRGECKVHDGAVEPVRGHGVLRWDAPIPFDEFEVAAEAQLRHQLRFLFAPDRANQSAAYMVVFINLINEINVASSKRWEHWDPPYPGHLSIHKEVYPRLTHSRWYRLGVRVRRDRMQVFLDGTMQMELPTPAPDARWFALGFSGGGRLRKLRFRPL